MATVSSAPRTTTFTTVATTAGPFNITFRLFDTDSLDVYVNGTRTTGYTIAATFSNGYTDSATLTLTTAVASGTQIIIDGALTPQRGSDYLLGDAALVSKLNIELARLWSALAEVKRDSERSLRAFEPVEPVDNAYDALVTADQAGAAAASSAAAAAASALAAATSANTAITFGLPGPKGWFVDAFGALGDGTTNDFAAFNLAIAALPAYGGELWLRNDGNYIVPSPLTLTTGGRAIVWRCGAGGLVNGAQVWNLPGRQESYITVGRPLVNVTNAAPGDNFYLDMRRAANFTGGTVSNQGQVARFENVIAATVGSAGPSGRVNEKGIVTIAQNYSANANAVALTAVAMGKANGGPLWGAEIATNSEVAPTIYAHRGAEINIGAWGEDTAGLRRVLNVASLSKAQFATYDAVDSVNDGILVEPSTCDMVYGLRMIDSPFNAAKFRETAIFVKTEAPLLANLEGIGTTGTVRIASNQNGAATQVAQIAFGGTRSDNVPFIYGSVRCAINDDTPGSEDGSVQIYTATAGTQTKKFGVLNSATNSIEMFVGGALKVVEVGAPDSGGAGYRMLRVAN